MVIMAMPIKKIFFIYNSYFNLQAQVSEKKHETQAISILISVEAIEI